MARRKRKNKDYRSGEEWRDWGEKFGKRMEKRGKDFGDEMAYFGERFGRHMERTGKDWERKSKDWWFDTFGFIGPLVASIFGLICLAVGIWFLNLVNFPLGNSFISSLSNFLFKNIHWFFGVFLFFNYSDYFSKRYPNYWWAISPLTTSIGIVVVILISVVILNLINASVNSELITGVTNFLFKNILGIFTIALVVGYVVTFFKKIIQMMIRR